MIAKSVAAFMAVAALCAAADPNQLTAGERAQGWRLLFDGKSTAGWLEVTGKPFPTNCWTVENACLKALPRDNGFQDIRTTDTFHNFELEWDWKMDAKGNSGVKYLIQKVDEWNNKEGRQARARGLEYQLAGADNDDANSSPARFAGAVYSIFAPVPKIVPRANEFNHSRLVVDGAHVEHWLDGTKVADFRLDAPDVQQHYPGMAPAPTAISLQNHQSEAWFRSIKIRVHP